jgi:hypothetical protein
MKNLFKTKTFWAGVGSIATGINFFVHGNVPDGIQLILSGFSFIFVRHSISKHEY